MARQILDVLLRLDKFAPFHHLFWTCSPWQLKRRETCARMAHVSPAIHAVDIYRDRLMPR
jgi:hypothetical protein